MSKGEAVRARQRQNKVNIRPFWYNLSCAPGGKPKCAPSNNDGPKSKPETLTRQQVRQMLRAKAKKDIMEQYGRKGEHSETVVYLGFSRRARRRTQMRIAHRWYQQVAENAPRIESPGKQAEAELNRGYVKDILRKLVAPFKAKGNTLAASGFGR